MSLRLKLVLSFLAIVVSVSVVVTVAFQINERLRQRVSGLSRHSGRIHVGPPAPNESIEVEGVWTESGFVASDLEYLAGARRPKLRGSLGAVSPGQHSLMLFGRRIGTDSETEFIGVSSLMELSGGDRVEISCRVDSSGNWWARKIRAGDIKDSNKVKGLVTQHSIDGSWPDTLEINGLVILIGREKRWGGAASELHHITTATQISITLRRIETLSGHLATSAARGSTAMSSDLEADLLSSIDEFEHQTGLLGASPVGGAASLVKLPAVTISAPGEPPRSLRGHTERFLEMMHSQPEAARTYAYEVLHRLIRDVLEPAVVNYRLEAEEQLADDVGDVVADTEIMKRILTATGLLALALAIGLALGLWHSISGPLSALSEAAVRIGHGGLDTRVSVKSGGELGTLARSFNLMAERLSESTVSIEKLNAVKEELRVSLAEKEVLLKEVHHRVKNNLQIVSSLIDLQSSHIADAETLSLFAESRSRIRSMALIHEQLYRSTDVDRIDFETYIELLVSGLERAVSAAPRLRIRTDVRPFRLDIDRAVACGLIINELVTNAIKHAFPQEATGEITVRFDCVHDGMCELIVSDNGKGIVETASQEVAPSLGMELVESLVGQLAGKMTVSSNGGSSFKITFPAGQQDAAS